MRNRYARLAEVLYGLLGKGGDALKSPFLLAIRLYWGWQFAQSGWGKLHNIDHVTEFFTTLNISFPHVNAIFVSNLEFFGGLLLIVGVATRLLGLVLSINLLVAYITADREALQSVFSDPSKFYNADPFTFLFASLIVLIFGAGFFSLDHVIARSIRRKQPAESPSWPVTAPVNAHS